MNKWSPWEWISKNTKIREFCAVMTRVPMNTSVCVYVINFYKFFLKWTYLKPPWIEKTYLLEYWNVLISLGHVGDIPMLVTQFEGFFMATVMLVATFSKLSPSDLKVVTNWSQSCHQLISSTSVTNIDVAWQMWKNNASLLSIELWILLWKLYKRNFINILNYFIWILTLTVDS